ncbi:MAG: lipoyl(octanoyl) transferase LipB [Candidatus Omnitrophota bacterium]|nr:lipoyl(octanoyl) transferase LipB [Candidatus Omnitrophota bacterium]
MDLKVIDLGLADYFQVWSLQKDILAKVINNDLSAALILCRHPPVITSGRKVSAASFKVSSGEILAKGIKLYNIDRGGDVTYHGPGQLTVYPIITLHYFKKDIHWFLRELESLVISSLGDFNLFCQRREGLTGVWLQNKKIASIGIAIRHWVTYHGLSINIKKDDLANFNLIRPCGMDIKVTSLEDALGKDANIEEVKLRLLDRFNEFCN